jgi:formate dehydrogenase subunit delta
MDIGNLIRMANRIGDFFNAMPDHQQAVSDVAAHIRRFWEPRMRAELLAFLERHPDGVADDARLSPLVLEAITVNREMLTPAAKVD